MRRLSPVLTFIVGLILASSVVAALGAVSKKPTSARACVSSKTRALRLRGKHGCAKGTKSLTLSARGPAGKRGLKGAQGLKGLKGDKGDKGDRGLKGDTGTPDTSNFYTKTESDSRFAPIDSGPHQLEIPGTAFVTIDSATTLGSNDFFGVYEKTGRQFLSADLQALPPGATITSVDFFIRHNIAGVAAGTEIDVSQADPTSSTSEGTLRQMKITDVDPAIVTKTLTFDNGYKPAAGVIPLLFWFPSATDIKDIIYGARVHYTRG